MKLNNYVKRNTSKNGSEFGSDLSKKSRNSSFGYRLKELRKKEGLSQKAMAKKLGIATSTYQRYEDGNLPKGDHLLKICHILKCSADWLLFGTEQTKEDKTELPKKEVLNSESRVNLDLLTQILEGIEEYLNEMGLELTPNKKAEIVTLLYEHFEVSGVKRETIKRFLKLVA